MSAIKKVASYTFEEFCFLVKEDQKADLIDGVIYMASPDNTKANDLFIRLASIMAFLVDETGQGKIFGSRVACRFDDHNGPEPDIVFVRKRRLHLVKVGHIRGFPDMAMEIVSPEGIDRDYNKKWKQYERAGIPEYWIIDELEQKVVLLRLTKQGKYREVAPIDGELHSKVLKGFFLRPDWLWQKPLPKKTKILQEMLKRI
jgi:Uma2 family endonuclease